MLSDSEVIVPKNIDEILEVISKKKAAVIAGGTDLLVRIKSGITPPPKVIVALDKISSLHKIAKKGNRVIIGASATYNEILHSELIRDNFPHLVGAAAEVGSPQIRSRGTIGGNIVNASPAGDSIPPLYTLGAELVLRCINGERRVRIDKFIKGPGKTVLRKNELLTAIEIEIPRGKPYYFFKRLGTRRALAVAKVSAAGYIGIDKGIVEKAKIALGAVGPTVVYSHSVEKILLGKKLCEGIISSSAEVSKADCNPIDDIRSEANYRREMVGVLVRRGLTKILEEIDG